jgi:hypothetical protein
MAFITQGTTFYSFATYDDVVQIDSRLFSANEGLTQDSVDESLIRSTERILDLLRNSDWWKSFYISRDGLVNVIVRQAVSVPALDPFLIRDRQGDFTDMTVYHALSNYLLPKVADFGNPDSAERQKIGFYDEKFRVLFSELTGDGDWYDFDNSGTITDEDKYPYPVNLVRRR